MAFFAARAAFEAGGLEAIVGIVPVVLGTVLAILLRALLRIVAEGERDLGRLALVAGASLGFITVAIQLQLERQWITIGWALEGAALAWLYGRVPHRGLLYASVALLATVFVRLAMNPEVLVYEPRGAMRILNWYLYTYVICAAAMFAAAWWLSRTSDRLASGVPRPSTLLPGAAVALLFLLLNIVIADYFATGPTIAFRFGVTVSQDLTYTIGWLAFGMMLLAAGIYVGSRAARVTSVALIAVTTFKCFLYDLGSLEGLYRVASFVGLAISLALVSLLHTWRPLLGVELRAGPAESTFAGQAACFQIFLGADSARSAIALGWPGMDRVLVDIPETGEVRVELLLPALRRGWLVAPRLRVESRFPLGLWVAWSGVDLQQQALVYPQPTSGSPMRSRAGGGDGDGQPAGEGVDDFRGLRQHQPAHEAAGRTNQCRPGCICQNNAHRAGRARSEGDANSDFMRALEDGRAQRAVQPNAGQHEPDQREEAGQQREQPLAHHRSIHHLLLRRDRRHAQERRRGTHFVPDPGADHA